MKSETKTYLLLAIPFFLLIALSTLSFPFIYDERAYVEASSVFYDFLPNIDFYDYHVETSQFRDKHVPALAVPPLYPILLVLTGSVFGFHAVVFRIISLVLGFLTAVLFNKLLKEIEADQRLINTLILITYPYFMLLSILIMTEALGIFLFIASLYSFVSGKRHWSWIFAILAVFTRQTYLFLPVGYVLYYLIEGRFSAKRVWKKRKDIGLALIPVLLFALLALYWGGITPHGYRLMTGFVDHVMTLSLPNLIFFVIILGFTFFPYLFTGGIPSKKSYWYLLLLPLFFFTPTSTCEGIICRIAESTLFYPFMFGLFMIGLLVIGTYVYRYNRKDNLFLSLIITLLAITMTTPLIRQRYFLMFIPLILPVLYRKVRNPAVLYGYLTFQIILAVAYVYYKIWIQQVGV